MTVFEIAASTELDNNHVRQAFLIKSLGFGVKNNYVSEIVKAQQKKVF